ncbi:MAG: hypothetical protein HOP13_08130 [Alphaproteobacteria bacterium]|nr:hypothetical protein [Alphaproteobacteria bacterium]
MSEGGLSIFDFVAIGLAMAAVGEIVAGQFFANRLDTHKLIPHLLLWEGIAMFACAGVVFIRQDFGISTLIAMIAIWMAGAAVGLLRAGIFDTPRE